MPKRILLADDSITIQKVVELTFSDGDYEVTAVNNGAKAIAKLSEMRPDIILSDIIMPEKNGYEVCEYVKSHPDFRTIPVILLTGTFEPFDPDRAEKAGSDAVVTKPFESQSLIQKVEELISQAHKDAPTQASADTAAFSLDEPETEPAAAGGGGFAHESDIFGAAAPAAASASELPFEEPAAPAFSGETRAFPRMSFEELQQMASETPAAPAPPSTPPASAPEPSPWDEPAAAPAFGGETRAFPSMSFEQLSQMASAPPQAAAPEASPWDEAPAPPPAAPEPAPWDEPAADSAFAGETRAIPRMSFEELQQLAAHTPSTPPPSPWDSAPTESASAAETTMPFAERPAQPSAPEPEPAPWDEPAASPAYSGETRAFPRMSFEELQQMASASPAPSAPQAEPEPWDQPAPAAAPSWSPVESPVEEQPPSPQELAQQEAPFEPEMSSAAPAPEPSWASQPEPEPMPQPEPEPIPAAATSASSSATSSSDLSDEQIDRIARRVVEMMSEQVVKNIAWEVIPDLAEMVVKERIRQLEAEA
jgi:CheY-like chemotaxis protein